MNVFVQWPFKVIQSRRFRYHSKEHMQLLVKQPACLSVIRCKFYTVL